MPLFLFFKRKELTRWLKANFRLWLKSSIRRHLRDLSAALEHSTSDRTLHIFFAQARGWRSYLVFFPIPLILAIIVVAPWRLLQCYGWKEINNNLAVAYILRLREAISQKLLGGLKPKVKIDWMIGNRRLLQKLKTIDEKDLVVIISHGSRSRILSGRKVITNSEVKRNKPLFALIKHSCGHIDKPEKVFGEGWALKLFAYRNRVGPMKFILDQLPFYSSKANAT